MNTVQGYILIDAENVATVVSAGVGSYTVEPRQIDNPLANNLGQGVIVGKSVIPARVLNNANYAPVAEVCGTLPIFIGDSDVLFIPDEEE